MMSIALAIQCSSSAAIREAMQRLRSTHLTKSRWLGVRNRYATDTIVRIQNEAGRRPPPTGTPARRPRQLGEYIAASVVLHCIDGWSYLANAVSAILDGE